MCNECYGNEVIYEFYVNHKTKQVADDWVYCTTCYPNNIGYFEAPWVTDYEVITIEQYNNYLKQGYKEY